MRRGLRLPGFVDEILVTLGQAVVPLCLVLIGRLAGALRRQGRDARRGSA
jgi:hypothetical protein